MPEDPPPPIAFVLHLSCSRDGRWTGRLVNAETQDSRAFTIWEDLIEELMRHGIHLDPRQPQKGDRTLTLHLRPEPEAVPEERS
ncbi:MAG: hypothetical protein ACPGNV_06765 [Mangrovicoccus sp.]